MKNILVALLLTPLLGCATVEHNIAEPKKAISDAGPTRVSLIAVIADPTRFDGKVVSVGGFYVHGFEISALYPSRDLSLSWANGVTLDFQKGATFVPARSDKLWKAASLWIEVEGVIDANEHGHMAGWPAGIHVKSIRAFPLEAP